MGRKTPFSVGERWKCHNPGTPVPFHFVIIGSSEKKDSKQCRIDVDDHPATCNGSYPCRGVQCTHGMEQRYTHKHLRKYAQHVEDGHGDK